MATDLEGIPIIVSPQNRNFNMLIPDHLDFYLRSAHEDFTMELLLNLLTDGTFFIDIGAHYGIYTLLIGTKYKNSKIIAFEPAPESYETLKKNLELNNLGNAEGYNLALSNKKGIRKFNIDTASSKSSFYHVPSEDIKAIIEVETITLDDFLGDIPKVPTVIKIDSEGHEICVVEGMRNILTNTDDIKMVIEFNLSILRSAGYKPEDLLEEIKQLGFDIYFINDEQRETYKIDESDLKKWDIYYGRGNSTRTFFNILCIKKQRSLSVCFFSHSSQLAEAERSLLEMISELIRNHGVICTVVLPEDGPLKEKLAEVGASTLIINYSWWCDSNILPDGGLSSRLDGNFKELLEQIRERLIKINPDVIITNTMVIPWGAITASLIGKPHVWFVHEFSEMGLHFYLQVQRVLEIIQESSNIIMLTNSDTVKQIFVKNDSVYNTLTIGQYVALSANDLHPDTKTIYKLLKNLKGAANPLSSPYFWFVKRLMLGAIEQDVLKPATQRITSEYQIS